MRARTRGNIIFEHRVGANGRLLGESAMTGENMVEESSKGVGAKTRNEKRGTGEEQRVRSTFPSDGSRQMALQVG